MTQSLLLPSSWKQVRGLLFDLDDTFLDHQSILPEAYLALNALADSGLQLVLCTGRPASWAECLSRILPICGAVAENGALGFVKRGPRVVEVDWAKKDRPRRRQALNEVVQEAHRCFPRLSPADDVGGRISDFTFDIGEFCKAKEEDVQSAINLAHRAGIRTTRSSVHLHYTLDREDKASGSLKLLRLLGQAMTQTPPTQVPKRKPFDQTRALSEWAYIGDSENDAPCFAAFRHNIAVANFSGDFSLPPRLRTEKPRGAGFAEFADALLKLRINEQ